MTNFLFIFFFLYLHRFEFPADIPSAFSPQFSSQLLSISTKHNVGKRTQPSFTPVLTATGSHKFMFKYFCIGNFSTVPGKDLQFSSEFSYPPNYHLILLVEGLHEINEGHINSHGEFCDLFYYYTKHICLIHIHPVSSKTRLLFPQLAFNSLPFSI